MKTLNIFHLVIYWAQKVHNDFLDDMVCWSVTPTHMCGYFIHGTWPFAFTMASAAAMPSGVTTGCAWLGRGESVTELMPFMNFLVHLYTCCSDRHASPHWTFIRRWFSMGFTPHYLKNGWQNAVFLWCMLQGGRQLYTTTEPSLCIPASYCHLSGTLQTTSIIAVILQDNRAVFRIFIALLRLSFDSPS
jgi:hypothetical protein